MAIPPLQLVESFFSAISIMPRVGKVAKGDVFPLQTRVSFQNAPRPGQMVIRLGVRKGANSTDEKGTYSFNVEICGLFSAESSLFSKDPEKAMSYVRVNGTSMLLGSVRELVLQLTSRGPFCPYMIPALSFLDLADKTLDAEPAHRQ